MKFYILVLSLLAIANCQLPIKPVGKYEIDLDLAPNLRWSSIIKDQQSNIKVMYTNLLKIFTIPSHIKKIVSTVIPTLPYREYVEELTGIAKEIEMSLEDVFLINLLYEIKTACTAIVYRNSKGEIEFAKKS